MGGDGGCRVGEVRAGTASPMPELKGFKLQQLVNFQKFSTLRVNVICRVQMARTSVVTQTVMKYSIVTIVKFVYVL